jgi:hypothetical protein
MKIAVLLGAMGPLGSGFVAGAGQTTLLDCPDLAGVQQGWNAE